MLQFLVVKDARRKYFSAIDRQFPGGIPPVVAFAGAGTVVATAGVLEQTGVLGALRDAIRDIVGTLAQFFLDTLTNIILSLTIVAKQ